MRVKDNIIRDKMQVPTCVPKKTDCRKVKTDYEVPKQIRTWLLYWNLPGYLILLGAGF